MQVKDKTPKEKRFKLVYGLTCSEEGCEESYVCETKQSVKARLQQHRRPSTNEAQNSAVYKHIKDSGHNVECHDVIILDREEQWHKQSIREAVWERIEQPSLNKKGDYVSTYHTPGTGHFMVFPVAFHVTHPKGQLPDEDREIRSQRRTSCKVSSSYRFILI